MTDQERLAVAIEALTRSVKAWQRELRRLLKNQRELGGIYDDE